MKRCACGTLLDLGGEAWRGAGLACYFLPTVTYTPSMTPQTSSGTHWWVWLSRAGLLVVCLACVSAYPSLPSLSSRHHHYVPTLSLPPFQPHSPHRRERDNGVLPLRPCQEGRRGLGPSSVPGRRRSEQELHTLGGGTRCVGVNCKREGRGKAGQRGGEAMGSKNGELPHTAAGREGVGDGGGRQDR
jgi:hypothetical protein